MDLTTPIVHLKGVGEQREKKLHSLGIYTLGDLLTHYPRDYKDRSQLTKVADLAMEEENTFLAQVQGEGVNSRFQKFIFTRLTVADETGKVGLLWYNQPYMKASLKIGQWYLFTGKFQKKYGKKEVLSPEFEAIGEGFAGGRIIPVYPSVQGISQKFLRGLVGEVLETLTQSLEEELPLWVRKEYFLAERNFAVEQIHFPKSEQAFYDARRRLVFEEFFLLQGALFALKAQQAQGQKGIVFTKGEALTAFQEKLPFALTKAQQRVLGELEGDMTTGKQMHRLIQGDVGSGKTAVAMAVAYWAIENGYQAVIMAPTEVLARQHYDSFSQIFENCGITTVLLTGSQKAKEKREALEAIATGNAQMIVGTHAVIQKGVVYHNLGLVITDEQHRFGVHQRETLMEKGEVPHTLVMTATPIPRTLALILYGDLDISIIDELPPGRKSIDTKAVNTSMHERIYAFIQKEVAAGRQAYVICPMIEENEKLEAQSVMEYTEILTAVLSSCRVAYVHGKMKSKEKQEIMEGFVQGNIDVLVSTTVIEVGINVPNATIMLVENSERFGLAQLHQLRGRVGRGGEKSYCILVSDSKTQVARQRLKTMVESQDGFVISEMDLKLRGSGEFFGTRQHGLPELKIANLYQDMEVLLEAQRGAGQLLEIDPFLEKEEHKAMRNHLEMLLIGKTLVI